MILVSAIYSNGPESIIGGRGRNIDFYISSLRNIANFNVPLVLYTHPNDAERTQELLYKYFKYLKIIPYKLSNFIYYKQFMFWKTANIKKINYNDRNEILCYCKPYWVKDTIDKEYFKELNSDDQYLWIDAGLTHHGIFPEKVGGVELLVDYDKNYYYPLNINNIFTPALMKKLCLRISKSKKLFFCSLPWQGDSYQILNILYKYNFINNYQKTNKITEHLIGGIFGGNKFLFLDFFNKYSSLLKIFLDNEFHCYEEQIFSAINYINNDLVYREKFDIWWFYSPGEPNSFLNEEANSFYKIFTNINNNIQHES